MSQQLRKDFIIIGLIVFGALCWYAHKNAIFVGQSDPSVEGTIPPSVPLPCDTLLILPGGADKPKDTDTDTTFSNLDMAAGWFNILYQEIGCFKHLETDELTPTSWSTMRLVVVPASASRRMRQDLVDSLGRWVEQGGILLVEQPDARWSATTQIPVGSASPRVTRRLTAADSAFRGALKDAMMGIPLTTTMYTAELGATGGRVKHRVLLEVDGRPAFIHAARGDGHSFVLTIDVARAITTLQQGRPLDDFSLPPSEDVSVPEGMTQPHVLVADKKMLDNTVPYADLLERVIMEQVSSQEPLPRIWYYPGKKAGAFIMSHEENSFGDKSLFLTDWETSRGVQSTNFITPDSMSPEALSQMAAQGHDVQLSWNRGFANQLQVRPTGIGPWRPIALEMTLMAQKDAIQEHLGGYAVKLSRIRGSTLDKDWSMTFQKLAAGPVAADSSYGPTTPKQFGYLFGTGRPFYPLDRTGGLLPVLELPFLFQDRETLNPKRILKLIKSSEASYHQVVTASFHSDTMAEQPRVEVINTWRRLFAFAQKHHHWVTTMRDFLLFEEARRASSFRSRFIVSERRLEVTVDMQAPRLKTRKPPAGEKAPRPILPSMAFPQNYLGNGVESVSIDGASIPLRHLGRSGDGFYHIVRVPSGKHAVHIVYSGKLIEAIVPEL